MDCDINLDSSSSSSSSCRYSPLIKVRKCSETKKEHEVELENDSLKSNHAKKDLPFKKSSTSKYEMSTPKQRDALIVEPSMNDLFSAHRFAPDLAQKTRF